MLFLLFDRTCICTSTQSHIHSHMDIDCAWTRCMCEYLFINVTIVVILFCFFAHSSAFRGRGKGLYSPFRRQHEFGRQRADTYHRIAHTHTCIDSYSYTIRQTSTDTNTSSTPHRIINKLINVK